MEEFNIVRVEKIESCEIIIKIIGKAHILSKLCVWNFIKAITVLSSNENHFSP